MDTFATTISRHRDVLFKSQLTPKQWRWINSTTGTVRGKISIFDVWLNWIKCTSDYYLPGPDSAAGNRTLLPSYCCSCSFRKREQSEGDKWDDWCEITHFEATSKFIFIFIFYLPPRSFSVCLKTWWTWTRRWWSSVAVNDVKKRNQYIRHQNSKPVYKIPLRLTDRLNTFDCFREVAHEGESVYSLFQAFNLPKL